MPCVADNPVLGLNFGHCHAFAGVVGSAGHLMLRCGGPTASDELKIPENDPVSPYCVQLAQLAQ